MENTGRISGFLPLTKYQKMRQNSEFFVYPCMGASDLKT